MTWLFDILNYFAALGATPFSLLLLGLFIIVSGMLYAATKRVRSRLEKELEQCRKERKRDLQYIFELSGLLHRLLIHGRSVSGGKRRKLDFEELDLEAERLLVRIKGEISP